MSEGRAQGSEDEVKRRGERCRPCLACSRRFGASGATKAGTLPGLLTFDVVYRALALRYRAPFGGLSTTRARRAGISRPGDVSRPGGRQVRVENGSRQEERWASEKLQKTAVKKHRRGVRDWSRTFSELDDDRRTKEDHERSRTSSRAHARDRASSRTDAGRKSRRTHRPSFVREEAGGIAGAVMTERDRQGPGEKAGQNERDGYATEPRDRELSAAGVGSTAGPGNEEKPLERPRVRKEPDGRGGDG